MNQNDKLLGPESAYYDIAGVRPEVDRINDLLNPYKGGVKRAEKQRELTNGTYDSTYDMFLVIPPNTPVSIAEEARIAANNVTKLLSK